MFPAVCMFICITTCKSKNYSRGVCFVFLGGFCPPPPSPLPPSICLNPSSTEFRLLANKRSEIRPSFPNFNHNWCLFLDAIFRFFICVWESLWAGLFFFFCVWLYLCLSLFSTVCACSMLGGHIFWCVVSWCRIERALGHDGDDHRHSDCSVVVLGWLGSHLIRFFS